VANASSASSAAPLATIDPFAPPTASLDLRGEPDPGNYTWARRGDRFWANLIDMLVLAPFALAGFAIGWSIDKMADLKGDEAAGMEWLFVFLLVLPMQIYQWYAVSTRGQTVAKRWLKLRIVRVDGSPLTFVHAVLLRSWVPFAIMSVFSAIGIAPIARLLNLADSVSIFTANRRMLHDLIAGTHVVNVAPPVVGA
jgi:uncharacterized RDD family membrane protein YckC